MAGEITIELKQLRFFAYHGLYKNEKELGGQFEIDLSVSFYPAENEIRAIKNTINYEQLFEFLKHEMQETRDLLETLAMEITEKIHLQFPKVKKVGIIITKLNPPIVSFTGKVAVSYSREF